MELKETKAFPFTMDEAWAALQHTAKLDMEPGSTTEAVSDSEWYATTPGASGSEPTVVHYTTTFDAAKHEATVEGASNKKHPHDFIVLTLAEAAEGVSLTVDIQINLGANIIARAMSPLVKIQAKNVIMKQVFGNFEALCKGEETNAMSKEELDEFARKAFEPSK